MGKETILNSISATFMQEACPGVFMSGKLEVSIQLIKKKLKLYFESKILYRLKNKRVFKEFTGSLEGKQARYIHKGGCAKRTERIILPL